MKKVISISLALLMLTSHLGFAVGTHFCGGHAVISELMLGEKHLDCGMGMMDMPKHMEGDFHLSAPGCCENQYISMEASDLLQKQQVLDLVPVFVAITVSNILYSFEYESEPNEPVFKDTSPSLPSRDLNILHQVFLI